jgi:hypothetical protein
VCVLHHLSSITVGQFSCKDAIAIAATLGRKKFDDQWVGRCKLKSYLFLYQLSLIQFIESYKAHQYKSHSQVIQKALELLRLQDQKATYQ